MIVQEVRQVIGYQILSGHTQVHWVPVLKLLSQLAERRACKNVSGKDGILTFPITKTPRFKFLKEELKKQLLIKIIKQSVKLVASSVNLRKEHEDFPILFV